MIPRRKRFHYAIVNLANVQHINPYFAKMGDDGWDLVSVSDGKAFFKRPKSTTLDQDISDYTSHLKKELAKYETELETSSPESLVAKMKGWKIESTEPETEPEYLKQAMEELL